MRIFAARLSLRSNQSHTMNTLQKIRPYLWFESDGRRAAEYYISIFPNSKIIRENEFVVTFELNGQNFSIMNRGSKADFNDAVTFYVTCNDQKEVDRYWNRFLADGGEELRSGWIRDKFGVIWQIIPSAFTKMFNHPDIDKARRVMDAASKMKKLVVRDLERAFSIEEEIGVD
jgi:predicted 3-demethylubiquinone-9 3-methyltransferase (glyoxalase superfamily)